MSPSGIRREPIRCADDRFHTTRWTLVLAAGDTQDPDSRRALEALCQAYWQPV